jgi:hypothetical protein
MTERAARMSWHDAETNNFIEDAGQLSRGRCRRVRGAHRGCPGAHKEGFMLAIRTGLLALVSLACVGDVPERAARTDFALATGFSTVSETEIETELRTADAIVARMTWNVATGSAVARFYGADYTSNHRFDLSNEVLSASRANELIHDRWLDFLRDTPPPPVPTGEISYDDDQDCWEGFWSSDEDLASDSCHLICCGYGEDEGASSFVGCREIGDGYWCMHCECQTLL